MYGYQWYEFTKIVIIKLWLAYEFVILWRKVKNDKTF